MSLKHQPAWQAGAPSQGQGQTSSWTPPPPPRELSAELGCGGGLGFLPSAGPSAPPRPDPVEMALDFTASLWELTNHQICVVAKTCVLHAMGEVTGTLSLAHPFAEEKTEALRESDRLQPHGSQC